MTGAIDNAGPAEEIDPTAGWDERRRAYEVKRAAENERGAELLANYSRPRPVVVQGRHRYLKRARR